MENTGAPVLVTGGAGYIGSIVTDELIENGYCVVVLDNLQSGHAEAIHPEAHFVKGDLADRALIDQVLVDHRVDAVMHFASHTLPGESMVSPFKYLRENVENALNLIESAVHHGVKRFVFSSTANLFDRPEQVPISENETVIPGSPYGESKHMVERALYWAGQIYAMRFVCLRYFNVAGAHPFKCLGEDHSPELHLIPLVMQVALGQRGYIELFGHDYPTLDGTCIRDFVHVMDLARAHILALRSLDFESSQVYHLGSGIGYSVRQIIELARQITGCAIPVVEKPRRPGDPSVLVAASNRIQTRLNWRPEFSDIRTILETAWTWHRNHPSGYSGQTIYRHHPH